MPFISSSFSLLGLGLGLRAVSQFRLLHMCAPCRLATLPMHAAAAIWRGWGRRAFRINRCVPQCTVVGKWV